MLKTLQIITSLFLLVALSLLARHFLLKMPAFPSINTNTLYHYRLPDTSGNLQSLAQYRGKIMVLNFWATWCSPCREEMPELSAFYAAHQTKNVIVLGIAQDDVQAVQGFLKSTPVRYPIVVEDGQSGLDVSLGNSQRVLPYTVIVDAKGKAVKTIMGRLNQSMLEMAIQPLLAD